MSLLRNSIGYVAAAGAAAIAGFLNAKGFNASWFYPYLPYFIALALIAGATFIWSLVTSNAKANQFVLLIEKVLEAAQTGQVPAAVQAITPPQMKLQVAVVAQEQADPQKRLPLK